MKTLFVRIPVLILFLFVSISIAQKNKQALPVAPQMPVNEESKLISYSAVVELKAAPDELYKRGINFFSSNYKNTADVLKKQDEANGEIEGVARFKIRNPADKDGVESEAGMVSYSINLKLKDGKYKYEFTKINWKQTSYYGIEKWMDKSSPSYKSNYDYYLIQVDEQIKKLVEELTKAMQKPSVQSKKADW
ncbi:MAG: DUF4468 domain-containing protein [Bacteroidetes bacterium]|nr:DUF4468 domain-containing protein [Bacteroidota bacterium]HET6243262.1 DUF4468 domain-containing protein [Bacteroidia bacterium]